MDDEDIAASAETAAEQTVTLLEYAEVLGEQRPKGKVMRVPAAEAERLVGAALARLATDDDRRIAGVS